MFLQCFSAFLIPSCNPSSLAFCMMFSAYKLNKQDDNIQPWCTPFLIWNQSVVPCPVLTVVLGLHIDFSGCRSGGLVCPSLSEFSTVCCVPHSQGFGIVNKAEVDVFVELSCFFDDPTDVGNLISGSSGFSKSFNFMATITICSDFGAQKNKVWHCFHCFPIYSPWSDGADTMIFVFWMLSFKPTFALSSFTFIKRLFSSSSLSAIRVLKEVTTILGDGRDTDKAQEEG